MLLTMTKQQALTFLQQHQPMPGEEELTEALIDKYDEVRKFFIKHPAPECIPLFLGSFADDTG
jgi:hypothetical protein